MRFITPLLILFLVVTTLNAQKLFNQDSHQHTSGHRCGFDEKIEALEKQHPELKKIRKEYLEKIIPEVLKTQSTNHSSAIIKVPVVFHVIHSGESVGSGQNISDQTIYDQLVTLNEDFQALNADFSSTPSRFADEIGNPEVQFCLAEIDPNGGPTSGITRHQFSTISDANIEGNIKPSTSWDPNRYYNIWTLAIPGTTSAGGTTGYAYLPFFGTVGDPSTDGTVLDYRFTGAGRSTLTHETGHYLGLYHTWGSGGCGAGSDDGFSDTPDQSYASSDDGWFSCANNFPSGPSSCGPEHMYVNYMDYASGSCYTSFTNQQIAVMRATLMGTIANPTSGNWASRNGLVQAASSVAGSCDGGGGGGTGNEPLLNDVGIVQIITPSMNACAEETIIPIIELQNQFGENTLTSASVRYKINGANNTNFSWSGSLEKGESAQVPLPPFTAPNGNFTFEVKVSSPNSQVDEWGFNDEEEISVLVNIPQSPPLLDDFETDALDPTNSGLTTVNYDNDVFVWQHITSTSGFGEGSGCLYFDNYSGFPSANPNNTRDALVTPPLNFTDLENAELSFDVAYAPYGQTQIENIDGLEILISTDCGATFSDVVYFKEGDELNTTGSVYAFLFQPISSQWRKETIDLSAYYGQETVSIAFVNHSGYGNLLYLDNINIGTGCAANATAEAQNISCFEACDGSINLSIDGFDETYTIQWNAESGIEDGTASAENLCAGTYEVTLTDAAACTIIRNITLTEPEGIQTNGFVFDETAVGENDGYAAVYGFNTETTDFTYEWSHGPLTPEIDGLAPGEYTVTISAAGIDCPTVETILINAYDCSPFVGTTFFEDVSCNGAFDGSASVNIEGGFAPYFYSWSNGFFGPAHSNFLAGDYTVTVSDFKGCEYIETITISEPSPISLEIISNPESGIGTEDASISVTPTGGVDGYSYLWSNNLTTSEITGLVAATYTVTVTDASDCSISESITIEEAACTGFQLEVITSNITCNGMTDGTATITALGGETPHSFSWTNSDIQTNTAQNLEAGVYSVIITDANGCSEVSEINISEPLALSTNLETQGELGLGQNNGAITASVEGGTEPYSYSWSNGSEEATIFNLMPGAYELTITDANECSIVESTSIEAFDCGNFGTETTFTNIECNGAATGTAIAFGANGTEPYSFEWSNGESSNQVTGLVAGTYTVSISDANACSNVETIVIEEANAIQSFVESTPTCFGQSTGTASANLGEEIIAQSYTWNNGMQGETISGLDAGIYSVEIADANGCMLNNEIEVLSYDEIQIEIEVNHETVENANDGIIFPSISGGTAPYFFNWSNNLTTASISELEPGMYDLTVTDINGCSSSSQNIEILVGDNPCSSFISSLSSSINTVSCFDGNDGSIELILNEAQDSYTINWENGDSSPLLDNLSAGTYFVTIENADCLLEQSYTVEEAQIISLEINGINESFLNFNNGSANVMANGGVPPFQFVWSNGNTGNEISNLAPGTYEVTATDANNCFETTSVLINEGVDPCADFAVDFEATNISCSGEASGSIILLPSNEIESNTYQWSNEEESPVLEGLTAGIYTVTITSDFAICSSELTIEILEPAPLAIEADLLNESIEDSNDGSISLVVFGGTENYSLEWSNGSSNSELSNLEPGSYTVTITDNNECQLIETYIIQEGNNECLGFGVDYSVNPVSCFGASDGQISLSIEGGNPPYIYTWNNGISSDEQLTGLEAGIYTVLVTDINDCEFALEMEVTQAPEFDLQSVLTNETVLGVNDGSIAITLEGGTTPYSYSWNNGETTPNIENLEPGIYTLDIEDANDCTLSETFEIVAGLDLCEGFSGELINTDVNCNGDLDGSILAEISNGTAPFEFQWSNDIEGGELVSEIGAGDYSVLVTDANNCTFFLETTINEPDALEFSVETSPVSLPNSNDGTISLTVSGGTPNYSFLWNTGDTEQNLSGLSTGSYGVTISDGNDCTSVLDIPVFLLEPDCTSFNAAFQIEAVSCFGEADGSVEISPTGGTAPYEIEWLNSLSGPTQENLAAGEYLVIITDATNCISEYEIVIPEPQELTLDLATKPNNCSSTSSAEALVSGGTGAIQYTWNTGQQSNAINNLEAGIYSVTASDANGCVTEGQIVVEESEINSPEFILTAEQSTCAGANDGFIAIEPVGGNPPYSYDWSNGDSGNILENLSPATYTAIIMDAEGCSFVVSQQIAEPNAISTDINVQNSANGLFDLTCNTQGGTPPYQYVWNNGANSLINEGVLMGQYFVTITDSNGCTTSDEFIIGNTAINAIEELTSLSIFPNPTDDLLQVALELSNSKELSISLFNIVGQQVFQEQINTASFVTKINTSHFPSGTYFLKISTDSGQISKKIVVVR